MGDGRCSIQSLTGLTGFDWLLTLLYTLGVVLFLVAYSLKVAGTRVGGFLFVPVLTGLSLIAALALAYSSESRYLLPRLFDHRTGIAALFAVIVAAFAFADLFVARLTAVIAWLLRPMVGRSRLGADLALLLGVTLPAAMALSLCFRVENRLVSGYALSRIYSPVGLTVRASYALPGHPMDLELRSESGGYMTFGEGWIGRFELPPAGGPGHVKVSRVADGLDYPRGLAILGDTLFVTELGPLPCKPSFPSCKGGDVQGTSIEATERIILRTSRARLLAFDIRHDGSLARRRVIVSDLPVANSDHGVNDVAVGPDGLLYVSIGNLDRLYRTKGLGPDLARPHADLLGTVITVKPNGTGLTVFARGLRNVYGLAFDSRGNLFGVDNDGLTQSGWRWEELLELRRGADYGYPQDGTFAPQPRRRDPALWVVSGVGSGGIAWLADAGGAGRLIVGACSSVDSIRLTAGANGNVGVGSRSDVTRLVELPGCVTTVKLQGNVVALGEFTFGSDSKPQLVLLDASEP